MVDEERNHQTEAGDPFSVFGELAQLDLEIQHNSTILASKVRELIFRFTIKKGQKPKLVLSAAERGLLSDIKEMYRDKTQLQKRGTGLIETIQESHNE
jgi:hypothetical protein